MDFRIDRSLALPIRQQIRGMIEYGISCGEFAVGEALPSVRDLAETLAVAPMTISQVYADLKRAGLIETRSGAGTYVADSTRAQIAARRGHAALHAEIDALIDHAETLGMRLPDLASLVNARLAYRTSAGRRVSVIMAGLFGDATRAYARAIAAQLGDTATVQPVTLESLLDDAETRARAASADLVVTFQTLHPQLAALLPSSTVAAIRFIPSEETRRELAAIDPLARLGVVSRFPEFLPILRAGVQRFAPHVEDLVAVDCSSTGAVAALADRTTAILATGVEPQGLLPAGVQLIEYRHLPDPGDVDRLVKPFVDRATRRQSLEDAT
jgi:DNA-binding transcriptional regulator YhcF (GntR family)